MWGKKKFGNLCWGKKRKKSSPGLPCTLQSELFGSGRPHHRPIRSHSSPCPPPACRLDLSSSLIALALFPAPPSSWQHSPIFIVLDFLLGEVISPLLARHSLLRLPLHLHTHWHMRARTRAHTITPTDIHSTWVLLRGLTSVFVLQTIISRLGFTPSSRLDALSMLRSW